MYIPIMLDFAYNAKHTGKAAIIFHESNLECIKFAWINLGMKHLVSYTTKIVAKVGQDSRLNLFCARIL